MKKKKENSCRKNLNKIAGNIFKNKAAISAIIVLLLVLTISFWKITGFHSIGSPPTQGTPFLNSTVSTNRTEGNITVFNVSTSDPDNDPVKNIINWKLNGSSLALLNMPFESDSNATFTRDYTQNNNNATVSNATWSSAGGQDGKGAYYFDGGNDFISVNDTGSLELSDNFTIEILFKPNGTFDISSEYYAGLIDKGNYGIYLDKSDGRLKFYMESNQTKILKNVSAGANGAVQAMLPYNGTLYVGGSFTGVSGLSGTSYIVKWNGTAWSVFNTNPSSNIWAIAAYNGAIYIGGDFTSGGSVGGARYIARGNGTDWLNVSNGTTARVRSLAVYKGELYAGGDFTGGAGGVGGTTRIARWNGTDWRNLSQGVTGSVNSMAVYNGELYVGSAGSAKDDAGNVVTNTAGLAVWNGTGWRGLSSSTPGAVRTISVYNNELYIGGAFTQVGTLAASRVVKWNGTGWSNLTNGTDNEVMSSAVYNGELYFGGSFINAGGVAGTVRIARWNLTNWLNVSNGTAGVPSGTAQVIALANYKGELYMGGFFDAAGGVAGTLNIARWSSGNTSNDTYVQSGTNSWPSNWQHVVITQNSGNISIYVNGILENNTMHKIEPSRRFMPLLIGASYGSRYGGPSSGGGEYFNGTIDFVRIYNRSLSAEQTKALYNNRTDLIVSQELAAGDIWQGCITPNDGNGDGAEACSNNITIRGINNAPNAINVLLSATSPFNTSNDNISLQFSYTDADNDAMQGNETMWFNNTIEAPEFRNYTTLWGANTTIGQNWSASIRVFDGTNWSSWVNTTNNITIRNSPPNATNIFLNSTLSTNRTDENITLRFTYVDNDNDAMSKNETMWFNWSGSAFIEASEFRNYTTLWGANTTKNQTWIASIRVYDGTAWSNWWNSTNITIANTPPNATNIFTNATTSLNNTLDNLTVYFTYSDADNDIMLYNETMWFNNTGTQIAEVPALRNRTTIGFGNTTKNQTWIASVRTYDGQEWSSWLNSTNITIRNTAPNITNISLNSTKGFNDTLDNISLYFTFSDLDGDLIIYNETRWFNLTGGSVKEAPEFRNYTTLWSKNTTGGQIWMASIRVYDGTEWSSWQNSTNISINSVLANFSIPLNNSEVIRGQDTGIGEDDKGVVDNILATTAKIYEGGSLAGLANFNCSFYLNSTFIGSNLTNSSGICILVHNKVNMTSGIYNLTVNFTSGDKGERSTERISFSLAQVNITLGIANARTVDGLLKYYDGDKATLLINITKDSALYDPGNITINATTSSLAFISRHAYPGDIVRMGAGQYYANTTVNYALGSSVRWEVYASENNFSSYASSAIHADVPVILPPSAESQASQIPGRVISDDDYSNFRVSPKEIYLKTKVREGKFFNFSINNTGDEQLNFKIEADFDLVSLSQTELSLKTKEHSKIFGQFIAPEAPGNYSGLIKISSRPGQQEIRIMAEVVEYPYEKPVIEEVALPEKNISEEKPASEEKPIERNVLKRVWMYLLIALLVVIDIILILGLKEDNKKPGYDEKSGYNKQPRKESGEKPLKESDEHEENEDKI